MTQDEIIRMAREAGAIRRYWGDNKEGFAFESDEQLERFAALVAEATKEEFIEIVRTIGGKFAQEAEEAIRSLK